MLKGPVTIDPAELQEKLAMHEREAKRIREFLQSLEDYSDSSKADPAAPSAGRPKKANPLLSILKDFAGRQSSEFTTDDAWDAVKGKGDFERAFITPTLKELSGEGIIKETQTPYGRRIGKYLPINGKEV